VPIPADFFGEGLVRLAVYRPSEGTSIISAPRSAMEISHFDDNKFPGKWYIKGPQGTSWELSSPNHVVEFGQNGDIPVPANYFNEEVHLSQKIQEIVNTGLRYGRILGFEACCVPSFDWRVDHQGQQARCRRRQDQVRPARRHSCPWRLLW